MIRFFLRSRIHRARVTEANAACEGSITIDRYLMNAAELAAFEKVDVYNVDNGNRFETYVIEGAPGSGEVCVNGAAAHLVEPGHKLIIACYCSLHEGQILSHRPKLVFVDEKNEVREIREAETAGTATV